MRAANHHNGRVDPTLHHVNLKTVRIDEMIDWYGRVIGLEVLHRADVGAWLTNDAANHRLALLSAPGLADDPEKAEHVGLHHTAYEFPTFDDLMHAFARLRADGIEPAFCLDHGMTISLYYRDPDGNFVELQTDVYGDWAQSKAYVQGSPDFAANPIGMFFDPVRLYEAHKSGRSLDELHRAAMSGAFKPDAIPNIGLPQHGAKS
jgi:catechol 2,3-dioxygenase